MSVVHKFKEQTRRIAGTTSPCASMKAAPLLQGSRARF